MPTEYTLQDLAALAGVTPRTIRYYIAQGLLPAPSQVGPAARYTETHLERLRAIRKLQGAHLPLAEIRAQLRSMGHAEIATLSEPTLSEPPMNSAADYIRDVLSPTRHGRPLPPFAVPAVAAPAVAAPSTTTRYDLPTPPTPASAGPPSAAPASAAGAAAAPAATTAMGEPERAQWERITLGPDIELHVRRPLTRQQNKRVEQLVSIARQLLEED